MRKIESTSTSTEEDNQCSHLSIKKGKEKDHQCKESVIDIPDNLEPLLRLEKCCIYKVPENLRKLNEDAYTPQLISIGPLHHGNKKLADMEKQKLIYLRKFCERNKEKTWKETWKDLLSIFGERCIRHSVENYEQSIRDHYAEKSMLCSHEYVKMILLDAVFIIELFLSDYKKKEKEEKEKEEKEEKENKEEEEKEKEEFDQEDDYMVKKVWLMNGIQQDLLLLENQLPYFVLNDLYNSAFPPNHQPTFDDLTFKYFQNYNPQNILIPPGILHFTDLLRYFMSQKHPSPQKSLKIHNLPSAEMLHEAGVKFTAVKTEEACLTDIDFKNGKLQIMPAELIMPEFKVNDTTEGVIRNLMALEQCHYPSEAYICNYIFLMDFLINTAKDVDLLVEKGVIVNWIGSNEDVAKLVNKLCINIIESHFCYDEICHKLNEYSKKCWPRFMATMFGVYFNSFWRGTASIAAFVLLLLTVAQTVASFLALW